jgi:flagellar biosynthesis component FlhA
MGFFAHPLVRRLLDELEARRQSMVSEQAEALRRFTHVERYAQSLLAEQITLKAMCAESERYARSLETENRQLTERFGEVERYALSLEDALKTSKHIEIDSKDGNQNERGPR